MAAANQPVHGPGFSARMHVARSRGAISGILLVLLGIWGALIPFVGPVFGYAYDPDVAWHYTVGRLLLEILPGVAAVIGGLALLVSTHRLTTLFGGWLGALAGAWFALGPTLSRLWNGGTSAAGAPASTALQQAALEEVGFFIGLGVVMLFVASVALGRQSVVSHKDVRRLAAARDGDAPTRRLSRRQRRRMAANTDHPDTRG